MEITEEMLAAIPPGNVLRPVDEFGAFWQLAEDECVRLVLATPMGQTSRELSYASASMKTARWLAACEADLGPDHAPLATSTGMELGRATPTTIGVAHEEAGALLLLSPDGYKTPGMPPRPGYLEGVRAVIDWAWRYGPPPQLGGQRSESAPSQ
ncbi:hypothetical protein [Kribbella sp. NPDC023855]|uniref:hypothetical protein n=1 Tax=Kribbella sp. NPDC023855 TaxID=3154698 RepID=UPI00340C765D